MARGSILSIDEGTTNVKSILVAGDGSVLSSGACPIRTQHPAPGWVQQDANEIWSGVLTAIRNCLKGHPANEIRALGISNQRESILAWNRVSGEPVGPVIIWQCRRTAAACDALIAEGHEATVIAKTGLPLDPLFPATKIKWLVENYCQSEATGNICVGTVDSWLIWKFTGGEVHATDASNAARTQLYNLQSGEWDTELCSLFGVDPSLLPTVCDSSGVFGLTKNVAGIPNAIPVAAAIGDSHGALFGHGAFNFGDSKVTLGTGSSVMTTIQKFIEPPKGITTTVAWQLGGNPTFAFEGNILVCASILPWTANLLGLQNVDALLELAKSVDSTLGVNLVPALVGLGSPHWNSSARGLISGLTFGAGPAHVAHAAALSMALQICDVFDIIKAEIPTGIGLLSVDGGPSRNEFIMQKLTDFLDHPVYTSESSEASALGASYLAGLEVGFWSGLAEIAEFDRRGRTFDSKLDDVARDSVRFSWSKAVTRSMRCD